MNASYFESLLHRVFEEEGLNAGERLELNDWLRSSKEARAQYLKASALHAALARHAKASELSPAIEAADSGKVEGRKSSWLLLASTIGAVVIAGWLGFLLMEKGSSKLVKVVGASDVQWVNGEAVPDDLAVNEPLGLASGCLRLEFAKGAVVTLEGPCRFEIKRADVIEVMHGRVSVHAPPGAQGFQVVTPGGTFVDLGTEFGLAVGNDGAAPVVLTEVFNGEVEVLATPKPTRLVKGESRALVQETGKSTLLSTVDEAPIILANHALEMPASSHDRSESNLAAGKPVTASGFYTSKHGSVFPPDRLTDGRINDSGVPGDWSFWLTPNEENGEFTVDLLKPEKVGRVSLQNTNNRGIGDRGVAAFEIYGSLDNERFTLLTSGRLPRVQAEQGQSFPFHEFGFAAAEVRYVKLVVTEHYRHPHRPDTRKDHGGGLNEIRIFAP